jgi:hypothetical protein
MDGVGGAMNFSLDLRKPMLLRTPDALRAMLSDLPESWITGDEGPGTCAPAKFPREVRSNR